LPLASVAWVEQCETRVFCAWGGPGFRHSASQTRVNALSAQPGLRASDYVFPISDLTVFPALISHPRFLQLQIIRNKL